MSIPDQSKMKSNCSNQKDCMEMLQLIVDGEASPEQKEHFLKHHLEECLPCYKNYHLEVEIRQLLKTKCTGEAPADLIEIIKARVAQNTPH
ncbi:MAG TPA: zf-HC2 domain-containing protein [Ohtaekwangia sp.]|nr:zf-HC2 domain-containing protein [Ohtaekwangia sp.]